MMGTCCTITKSTLQLKRQGNVSSSTFSFWQLYRLYSSTTAAMFIYKIGETQLDIAPLSFLHTFNNISCALWNDLKRGWTGCIFSDHESVRHVSRFHVIEVDTNLTIFEIQNFLCSIDHFCSFGPREGMYFCSLWSMVLWLGMTIKWVLGFHSMVVDSNPPHHRQFQLFIVSTLIFMKLQNFWKLQNSVFSTNSVIRVVVNCTFFI
jgi:hypothetical protein